MDASSATLTITKVDRIPVPQTDPETWPIVYTYDGTYDPYGNGYFEFSGEFETQRIRRLEVQPSPSGVTLVCGLGDRRLSEDKVQKGPMS
jgi:hypothetical protein